MKCFLASFLLCCFAHGASLQDHSLDPVQIRSLALTLGLSADLDLLQETQRAWLRPSNKERWELDELPLEKAKLVFQWAEQQGIFSPCTPVLSEYDTALIWGGTTERMQSRLTYLISLWTQGIRFKQMVWLVSDRELDPQVDQGALECLTEAESAKKLWESAAMPPEMKQLEVFFLSALRTQPLKRPGAKETLNTWLARYPTPCRALFVSNQPFCSYHFLILKAWLPDAFAFDVVGEGCQADTYPAMGAVILDSVARCIYQDPKLRSLSD